MDTVIDFENLPDPQAASTTYSRDAFNQGVADVYAEYRRALAQRTFMLRRKMTLSPAFEAYYHRLETWFDQAEQQQTIYDETVRTPANVRLQRQCHFIDMLDQGHEALSIDPDHEVFRITYLDSMAQTNRAANFGRSEIDHLLQIGILVETPDQHDPSRNRVTFNHTRIPA